MARIRVKAGTVGYYDGARHMRKTAGDPPFVCEDAQAAHLVDVGAAEYVSAPQPPVLPEAPAHESVDFASMTVEQLKAYAAENGIDVAGCKKKADYITTITESEEDDGDEMPDLSAADLE